MYHRVVADQAAATNMHYIPQRSFIEQVDYLVASGHRVLSWNEITAGGRDCNATTLGLTFDDGNLSDMTCADILRSRGLSALFFVPTSYLERTGYLAKADVAALSRQEMGIGSHSHHHAQLVHLRDLQLHDELRRSKEILEDITGLCVEHLSFPGGSYNARVLAAARKVGYKYFYTSQWGMNGAKETAAGIVRRIPVVSGLHTADFQTLVQMQNYRTKMVQFHLKEFAKRALGEQRYLRLRSVLTK